MQPLALHCACFAWQWKPQIHSGGELVDTSRHLLAVSWHKRIAGSLGCAMTPSILSHSKHVTWTALMIDWPRAGALVALALDGQTTRNGRGGRKRWRFFACKVGFLLQDRRKFGTAGLFRQTEHAKAVIRTVLYTLTTATNFNAAA